MVRSRAPESESDWPCLVGGASAVFAVGDRVSVRCASGDLVAIAVRVLRFNLRGLCRLAIRLLRKSRSRKQRDAESRQKQLRVEVFH